MRSLIGGEEPDTSIVGPVLLAASVVVMPLLAAAKRRVAVQLGAAFGVASRRGPR